jgi:hypothetical protein
MKKFENNILVECDECYQIVYEKIRNKKNFDIPNITGGRKLLLEFIIKILLIKGDYHNYPHRSILNVKNELESQGQFCSEEIDEIISISEHKTTVLSKEFLENLPDGSLDPYPFEDDGFGRTIPKYYDVFYSFSGYSCDLIECLGLCPLELEKVPCPDCEGTVTNSPDNVSSGLEKDLICPKCRNLYSGLFEMKGIIRRGYPTHHGNWGNIEPEFYFSGTDYFTILHPNCEKSEQEDKKGVMEVIGVWFDDGYRVVLSFECKYCGVRNAIKPFLRRTPRIHLLNESGAEWRRVVSSLEGFLEREEDETLEFKSSLRWDYKRICRNDDLQIAVIKSLVGFMNREGGILVIGVDNDKNVLGLENDYNLFGCDAGSDIFENHIRSLITNHIQASSNLLIDFKFEKYFDEPNKKFREVCCISIVKSSTPILFQDYLFVRLGNWTQKLTTQEAIDYSQERFFIK